MTLEDSIERGEAVFGRIHDLRNAAITEQGDPHWRPSSVRIGIANYEDLLTYLHQTKAMVSYAYTALYQERILGLDIERMYKPVELEVY